MELLYYYALAHQDSFDVRWVKKKSIQVVKASSKASSNASSKASSKANKASEIRKR